MVDHPKYEYKFVLITQEKKDDDSGDWDSMTVHDAVEEINRLGLEGWMVRSHTFTNVKHPVSISYVLVRKI